VRFVRLSKLPTEGTGEGRDTLELSDFGAPVDIPDLPPLG
jgi:hypothetical protein